MRGTPRMRAASAASRARRSGVPMGVGSPLVRSQIVTSWPRIRSARIVPPMPISTSSGWGPMARIFMGSRSCPLDEAQAVRKPARDLRLQHSQVVRAAGLGVIQAAPELTGRILVNAGHRQLDHAQAVIGGLYPHLQRHPVAGLGQDELAQRLHAVSFETAPGVGDRITRDGPQLGYKFLVQAETIWGRWISRHRRIQIPAAGDDVCAADRPQEIGDALRLVLLIAIDGDGDVIPSADGLPKPGDPGLAVTSGYIMTG